MVNGRNGRGIRGSVSGVPASPLLSIYVALYPPFLHSLFHAHPGNKRMYDGIGLETGYLSAHVGTRILSLEYEPGTEEESRSIHDEVQSRAAKQEAGSTVLYM